MKKAQFVYLGFLVFFTIATIVAGEFIMLPLWKGLSRDLLLMGFVAKPNMLIDDTATNSMGFTGDNLDINKSPGTIRILTLGGSAMFNRRMTERLKHSLIKGRDRSIEILGAALRTHTTQASVIKYKLLRKYHFDYVLIYHGINDLWANHIALKNFQSDYSHLGPWYKRNIWLDNCLICRTIYKKWLWNGPFLGAGWDLSHLHSETTFKRNLQTLVDDIHQDDSTPILMTFAWSIPDNYTQEAFLNHSIGYNNPTDYDPWPVELWGSQDLVRKGLGIHNRIIRDIAINNGVLLIDQEKLMGKELHWYGDLCHFSEEGTDKFIENITKFFIQQNLFS